MLGQGADHAGHAIDGVVPQLRRRAVAGHAAGPDLAAGGPLVPVDQVERGRLGHDGEVDPRRILREVRRAGVGEFLVDRAGHDHRRRAGGAFAGQAGERGEHGRHAPLDVARAPAIHPAVADRRVERVDGHAVGRHGVLVCVEEDHASGVGVEPGDDVVPPGADRVAAARDAQVAEEADEVLRDRRLAEPRPDQRPAHRVDAGDGDQVGQQAGHGVHGRAPAGRSRSRRDGHFRRGDLNRPAR